MESFLFGYPGGLSGPDAAGLFSANGDELCSSAVKYGIYIRPLLTDMLKKKVFLCRTPGKMNPDSPGNGFAAKTERIAAGHETHRRASFRREPRWMALNERKDPMASLCFPFPSEKGNLKKRTDGTVFQISLKEKRLSRKNLKLIKFEQFFNFS